MPLRPALEQKILTLSLALVTILLLLSWSLAAWTTQRELTARLLGSIEILRTRETTDLPRISGINLLRLNASGEQIAPSAEALQPYTPGKELVQALERGQGTTVVDGELRYSLAKRTPQGQLEGFLVATAPLDNVSASRNRRFFWGSILALLSGGLFWARMTALAAPRQELISEITRVQKGDTRNPIILPAGHPFRTVADTVNRLTDDLERQTRIISEQHHRQQILLNSISEGILVLDNDLNITGINPVAANWLETGHPTRAQGKALYKLCRNPTLLSMIDSLLSSGEMKEAHLHLERTGEEDRIVQLRGSLLIDRDQTEGVIILMQDVTTLRRLETLRQDFVANVSHELRTPLTSIKGYAELLTEETDDQESVQKYSDRILMQSERMVNIIDDLLSLTRIESAHGPESVTRCEVRPLLENAVALSEDAAQRRNLTLKIEAEDGLTAVLHAPLFEQAILNLVQNAVKYTHPATTITLKAYQHGDTAVIEVQDHGPGIAPQHHARLFERFYRVDKARSRAVGGTGLGLSIVKHIAQLHHGTVDVESELGKGTHFRLKVPLGL